MNPQRCQTQNVTSVKAFPQSIGTTTSPATNVTVNTSNAVLYADVTFASTNQPWVNGNNTFTAIARDAYGRRDTNSLTVLQATNVYAYDLNGNLLYDGRRAFDYDDENQLIRVTVTNGWKSEFTYDGKLRRRIVKEFTWNGSWVQTNEVHYIYDGNLVVQERDANNLPQVTYTRGNDLSRMLQGAGGIGGLLARTDNSKLLVGDTFASALYHADGNGNVTCLIYPNQMVAAKYLYDPYGNMLSQYGLLADANSYRFSSKEWNANSGTYYYLYRFYDPSFQRWSNHDPIEEKGGLNLYEFVKNDPLNHRDAKGLLGWDIIIEILSEWLDSNPDRAKHCSLTSQKKVYIFTDKNGNPLPGSSSQKVCTYTCGDPDDIHTLATKTVYVDPCKDCPKGDDVANNPPKHAPPGGSF
jgi:RHS repeat-associated protein